MNNKCNASSSAVYDGFCSRTCRPGGHVYVDFGGDRYVGARVVGHGQGQQPELMGHFDGSHQVRRVARLAHCDVEHVVQFRVGSLYCHR